MSFTFLVSLLVVATSMWITALTLSPEQRAISMLGSTNAIVQPSELQMVEPGSELVAPEWLASGSLQVQAFPLWDAWVPLVINDDQPETYHYSELSLPSPKLDGSVVLVDGAWPSAPGQCVTTNAGDRARSSIGEWSLAIVGHVKDVFYPTSSNVLCAPGTWQTWRLTATEQSSNSASAGVTFAFIGQPDAVHYEVSQKANSGYFGPVGTFMVSSRELMLKSSALTANKFLGQLAPMLAFPFVIAVIAAARLARWSGVVIRALERAGVAEKPMHRVFTMTGLLGVIVASLCGSVAGALVAAVTRPLALALNDGVPLSDWSFPLVDTVILLVVCIIGAGIGFEIGDAVARSNLGQQDRAARPLGRASLIVSTVMAAIVGAIGIWVLVTSSGRNWWMLGGGVILVIAFSLLAPVLACVAGLALSRRAVTPGTLAGRIIAEDSRRWAIISVVASIILGLVFTLFTISASSIAGQLVLEASRVPSGSVRFEISDFTGETVPATTIGQFESDLGLGGPAVTMKEIGVALGEWGVIQSVDSVEDAQRLLGPLSQEAVKTLRQGGALVIGQFTEGRTSATAWVVPEGDVTADIPIMDMKTDKDHRWATGGGVVLATALSPALRDTPTYRVWNVYQGLSFNQEARARQWTVDTGMDEFRVEAYQPAFGFSFPQWLAVSLCGFGLLLAPILALTLRHEVRTLTELASSLKSLGVAQSWIRKVFGTLAGTTISVSVITALLSAFVSIVMLKALYPTVFDLAGTPWWALGGFVIGLVAATELAVLSSVHGLTRKKHPITM